jgi:hypothetical protein
MIDAKTGLQDPRVMLGSNEAVFLALHDCFAPSLHSVKAEDDKRARGTLLTC